MVVNLLSKFRTVMGYLSREKGERLPLSGNHVSRLIGECGECIMWMNDVLGGRTCQSVFSESTGVKADAG